MQLHGSGRVGGKLKGTRRRIFIWVAAAIAIAALGTFGFFTQQNIREERNQQRFANFLGGVLTVTSKIATPVQLSLAEIPGKPVGACTVFDYQGLQELQNFLGETFSRVFWESFKVDDRKSGLVLVYDDTIVAIEPRALVSPNYFSTTETKCSREDSTVIIIDGRRVAVHVTR